MGILVSISGPMLLVIVRTVFLINWEIVHALYDEDPDHHHLLAIITTVNLEILKTHLRDPLAMTLSGMVSSVKVPAAVVASLPHGSECSCTHTQLIGLR